jgi:hypothetical protein
MYTHTKKTKLTQDEYYSVQCQFEVTPNPDESYGATGEHWKLKTLLEEFGFYSKTTRQAYFMANDLIMKGYDYEPSSYQN